MNYSSDGDETRLKLRYVGTALSSGRINVDQFVTALDGLKETLYLCGSAVNGDAVQSDLSIEAEMRAQSFGFNVIFLIGAAAQLITPDYVKSALDVVKIAFGDNGLVALFKLTRGEPPSNVARTVQGDGNVFVEGDLKAPLTVDNSVHITNNIIVPAEVWDCYTREDIRRSLYDVVKPLNVEGIDALETLTEDGVKTTITADEASSFVPRREMPESFDSFDPFLDELVVIKQSFRPGRRWVFESTTQGVFGALVQDREFLNRQERREIAIRNGDRILAEYKRRTWPTDKRKVKQREPDYFITKVHDIIEPRSRDGQLGLDL